MEFIVDFRRRLGASIHREVPGPDAMLRRLLAGSLQLSFHPPYS